MRASLKCAFFILAGFAWLSAARGEWDRFSPFEPGAPPKKFPLTALTLVKHHDPSDRTMQFELFVPGRTKAALTLGWPGNDDCTLTLAPTGAAARFSMKIGWPSPVCDAEAATTDLNADKIPDYIVVTHSGGCGLAAQITFVTFLLSSREGYVGHNLYSFDASPTDLADLDGDGRPEFVHGTFVWADAGRDGRAHNYWAYNVLGFAGTNIVSANATDRRFPKWVMYSFEPNHTETRQLTGEQRMRHWLAAWVDEGRSSRRTPFFAFRFLASEQLRGSQ